MTTPSEPHVSLDPTPEPILEFARSAFLPELRRAIHAVPAQTSLAPAEGLIEEWQEALELDTAQFEERLAAEGLSRTELAQLLAGRELAEGAGPSPAWQGTLRAVLRRIGDGAAASPIAPATASGPPFASVLDSFVAVAWDDLLARAARPTDFEIDWTSLTPKLQGHLRTLLLQICQRTLVLELNVARLEGWLVGETPAARYEYYVETLRRKPEVWVRLLHEYQAMARLLCTTMTYWVEGLVELLAHLSADYPRLVGRSLASPEASPGLLPDGRRLRLIDLAGGLSDPHRGGRGVWKLTFAGDAGNAPSRLIYKPRALAVDAHFQALLAFCNQGARRGALHLADLRHTALPVPEQGFPEFRELRLLDCGDHGWVEFVERRDCVDASAAVRFYLRQGAYLALLYALDGADVHTENVIASGEHPMLVDLETLFHPWLPLKPEGDDAKARALVLLRDSVMRTALLPGRAWGDRERAGINIGGLGNGNTQLSPQASLEWALSATDAMHASERRLEIPPGDNVPQVDGAMVPVSHHVEELVAGFEAMLRFLVEERQALLAPGGALRAFADDPVRRLLRSTSAYGHLLEPSYHPDNLRDTLDRERLFDLLWKVSQGKAPLLRVIPAEKEDLRHGDIPYFSTRPDSRDLWDSRGERIPDVFATPALEIVAAHLLGIGEREIEEQVFIVRAAVSAAAVSSVAPSSPAPAPLGSRAWKALDAALVLGERIAARAILGKRDATWLGMDSSTDGTAVEVAPLGGGLYDGAGGIALFLGYLGHLAGEERFTRLAARAALVSRAALDSGADEPSGFSGSLSHLYTLSHLAKLWGDPALLPPLGPILERVAAQIAADAKFDVIYGAAGYILALLAIHELTGNEQALAVAAAAGRQLKAGAQREEAGVSWPCALSARHLLGFSHGAAGVGAALLRLARAASEHAELGVDAAELAALGEAAFDFERSQFDATAGNWPDLREQAGGTASKPQFVLAYCHGAPGIALSRLSALSLAPGMPARREVEVAVETTLAGRVQKGQTLCHGEIGNMMIVQRAAARLGRADWQQQVDRRLGVTLERLAVRGPECGFDFPAAAPALMNGVAGIGYGLLCLTRPAEVPFVLDLSAVSAR
jgi:type 2 lantibiotic biosynthesis protein LanM